MLFVRAFTPEEQQELARRLKSATKTRVYIRLKTVELSHQGKNVEEIAALLGRHPNSVRSYIHRFNEGGFGSLMPRWAGGPSQKLGGLDKEYFEDVLSRAPSQFEKLGTHAQNWTYPLLEQYLLLYEDRQVCQTTIWNHLRRSKYTSGRAKLSVTSPDPEYQVKRERVEELEKKVSRGA